MGGGFFVTDSSHREEYEEGGVTSFVVIACIVAAMGGLLFGYDIGISGGVTSMEEFLTRFFPDMQRQMQNETGRETEYCKYDNELLTLFTSSLYLAALFASFLASSITRLFGRKVSMTIGGLAFLSGALLNGFAISLEMLIIGRLLLGVGVGFVNQAVPLYLSEMAPAKIRGALNMAFQLAITMGILAANIINYITPSLKNGVGWRLSLGLAAVPASVLLVGSFFLPETPNSILERGNKEEAKRMLQKIRGTMEVEHEFMDLCAACESAKSVQHPWTNIAQTKYRPQLVFCTFIPFFQQLTGINVIMFYAPVLFRTIGFGKDASLISAVITGLVNVLSTLVSIYSVDKFGRRGLFLAGGIQMIVTQVAVGSIIGWKFGVNGEGSLSPVDTQILLGLICLYVAGFAWSWGPLGWLVPSEICPLEIRSAGQSLNVSVNMFFTFLIGQFFVTMLCHMKFGLFYFFAVLVLIMTVFIHFLLPETKGVPIEEMARVWKDHSFWGKYARVVDGGDTDDGDDVYVFSVKA
ncbi:hypothetical protein HID58_077437 [Brassica napus]|uniref:BnaC02g42230D protein n=2 Tax=Brassica napus TaxID=3708 RepID=A0A078I8M7_BRANA|nr:sugar transport protein 11 [Brassica napus]KAH0870415.1 hypothetical protein HID58_077437 [Brassica napus]CAF2017231.1 unnamed protein product [Brassica napus]CDY45759.1 BnaC02g42230D [Brassica napus]